MTDNEIIKVLECCSKSKSNEECKKLGCPFFDKDIDMCGTINSETIIQVNALDLIKRQKTEIDILIRKKEALKDEIAEKQAEKERLEYVLMAVMHSVDKWLEGGELKQDEANRACTMREKTLKITEKLHKKIDGLQKANQESFVAIEKRKGEIERLNASNNALRKSNEKMFATISKQDAEIERLTAMVEAAEDYLNPLPFKNAYDEAIDKAKSEAYREFAEMINNMLTDYEPYDTLHIYEVRDRIDIAEDELTRNSHGTCTESNE